jgi:hypothetical protein
MFRHADVLAEVVGAVVEMVAVAVVVALLDGLRPLILTYPNNPRPLLPFRRHPSSNNPLLRPHKTTILSLHCPANTLITTRFPRIRTMRQRAVLMLNLLLRVLVKLTQPLPTTWLLLPAVLRL